MYLSEFVLPLVANMTEVLVVQVRGFLAVRCAQNGEEARVLCAFVVVEFFITVPTRYHFQHGAQEATVPGIVMYLNYDSSILLHFDKNISHSVSCYGLNRKYPHKILLDTRSLGDLRQEGK